MNVSINITGTEDIVSHIDDIINAIPKRLEEVQKRIASKVISDANDIINSNINDSHGNISKSMKVKTGDELVIYIDPKNKPAIYQHEGTKSHFVEPINKKALHWDDKFSKGHKVRGIKPVKFLEKAFMNNKTYIINEIREAIEDSI